MWRTNRQGKIYLNPTAAREMNSIATQLIANYAGPQWQKGKIYVAIIVHRPDLRSDPCNFIDTICDAVKRATGVDDRYYAVRLDWIHDKQEPRIEIAVWQRLKEEQCSE
jgi:hypothetical protein